MDSKMDVEKTWMLINKLNEKVHQLLRNRVGQIFQEDRTLLDTNSLKTRTQVPVAL
jgi:ABC-type ATPase involved in cell division